MRWDTRSTSAGRRFAWCSCRISPGAAAARLVAPSRRPAGRARGARSAPANPGRLHLVQLQDLAGAAAGRASGAHLVDVQLVELKGVRSAQANPSRRTRWPAAGARWHRGRAPGMQLVNVQLHELNQGVTLNNSRLRKTTSSPHRQRRVGIRGLL